MNKTQKSNKKLNHFLFAFAPEEINLSLIVVKIREKKGTHRLIVNGIYSCAS